MQNLVCRMQHAIYILAVSHHSILVLWYPGTVYIVCGIMVLLVMAADCDAMTLYGRPSSLNVQKVTWMMEEVGMQNIKMEHASGWLGKYWLK